MADPDVSVSAASSVTVNGRQRRLDGVAAHTNALDWLRAGGLTGSKEGCAEGECGACAMLVATPSPDGGAAWTAVNSCLVPAHALAGQEVVTAEGLGTPESLHPVQAAMAAGGGSQCGYCTPGFVCSMAGEYYRADRIPGEADEHHGPNGFDLHALSGNLCRCTGYRPIRDAAYDLPQVAHDDPMAARLRHPAPAAVPTDVVVAGARFVRPGTLADTLGLLEDVPDATVVAGATDWGVDVNLRGARAPLVIAIERLPELRSLRVDAEEVEIGAALTLAEIERALSGRVSLLAQLIPQFASPLIRNRATLGGNLGTGSPIGDSLPALLALDARVDLVSAGGQREVPFAEYFTGYRQSVRHPAELIRALRFPVPRAGLTGFHKVAKRRFDDISSVAVAFVLDVHEGIVREARIGLGGVAAMPVRAYAAEQALVGRPWTLATVKEVAPVLGEEGTPLSDHRASAEYRRAMLENSLRALFARNPRVTHSAVSA